MPQVLMVVSAADRLTLRDGSRHETGYWASEVVEPYEALTGAGYDIVVATPGGRVPTPDARSLGDGGVGDPAAMAPQLAKPASLSEQQDVTAYGAVVLPGGHGPMQDLAGDPHLGRILRDAVSAGVPVAAICHGPAGLLSAVQDPEATWPFAGRSMTAFSDAEEGELASQLPWSLESELAASGAKLELADEPYAEKVVVDGLLVTGQNPASARAAAEALVALLASRR